jgi:hypothetical protein
MNCTVSMALFPCTCLSPAIGPPTLGPDSRASSLARIRASHPTASSQRHTAGSITRCRTDTVLPPGSADRLCRMRDLHLHPKTTPYVSNLGVWRIAGPQGELRRAGHLARADVQCLHQRVTSAGPISKPKKVQCTWRAASGSITSKYAVSPISTSRLWRSKGILRSSVQPCRLLRPSGPGVDHAHDQRPGTASAHPNRASKISAANARTIPTISDRCRDSLNTTTPIRARNRIIHMV